MFHVVKSKDTLYSIAKHSGHNYYELSKFNHITKPYKIIIGQKIWLGDLIINQKASNCLIENLKNNNKNNINCGLIFKNSFNISNFLKYNNQYNLFLNKTGFFCKKNINKNNLFLNKKSIFSNNWYWPIKSNDIKHFDNKMLNNKNIEITTFKNQPIFAAASGEVVFVTDLFKKYGQLIIIKHSENYLSIYSFCGSVLVKQKDKVYAKQKIAMIRSSSDTNLVRLYFEIRYQGESVNPLNLLPKLYF